MFISLIKCNWIENLFKKSFWWKTQYIEKMYVVGTHRGYSNVYLQTYVTENKEENYLEIYFPSIMSIVFTSFKQK